MKFRNLLAGTIVAAAAAVGAWWLSGQRSAGPSATEASREAISAEAQAVVQPSGPDSTRGATAEASVSPVTQPATGGLPEMAASELPPEASGLPELREVPAQSAPPVRDELHSVPDASAPRASGQPELEVQPQPQPPPASSSPDELSELAPSGQGNTSTR